MNENANFNYTTFLYCGLYQKEQTAPVAVRTIEKAATGQLPIKGTTKDIDPETLGKEIERHGYSYDQIEYPDDTLNVTDQSIFIRDERISKMDYENGRTEIRHSVQIDTSIHKVNGRIRLQLDNGRLLELEDYDSDSDDGFRYLYKGFMPILHKYVIEQSLWESTRYLLIDKNIGRMDTILGLPFVSPDGRKVFSHCSNPFEAKHQGWLRHCTEDVQFWLSDGSTFNTYFAEWRILELYWSDSSSVNIKAVWWNEEADIWENEDNAFYMKIELCRANEKRDAKYKSLIDMWKGKYIFPVANKPRDQLDDFIIIKQDTAIYQEFNYWHIQQFGIRLRGSKDWLRLRYNSATVTSRNLLMTKDFGIIRFDGNQYLFESPYLDYKFKRKSIYVLSREGDKP